MQCFVLVFAHLHCQYFIVYTTFHGDTKSHVFSLYLINFSAIFVFLFRAPFSLMLICFELIFFVPSAIFDVIYPSKFQFRLLLLLITRKALFSLVALKKVLVSFMFIPTVIVITMIMIEIKS